MSIPLQMLDSFPSSQGTEDQDVQAAVLDADDDLGLEYLEPTQLSSTASGGSRRLISPPVDDLPPRNPFEDLTARDQNTPNNAAPQRRPPDAVMATPAEDDEDKENEDPAPANRAPIGPDGDSFSDTPLRSNAPRFPPIPIGNSISPFFSDLSGLSGADIRVPNRYQAGNVEQGSEPSSALSNRTIYYGESSSEDEPTPTRIGVIRRPNPPARRTLNFLPRIAEIHYNSPSFWDAED